MNELNQTYTYQFSPEPGVHIILQPLDKWSIDLLVPLLAKRELYDYIENFSDDVAALTSRITHWEERNFQFVGKEMWINWVVYMRETGKKNSSTVIGHFQATIQESQTRLPRSPESERKNYSCYLGWMMAREQQNRGFSTLLVQAVLEQLHKLFPNIVCRARIHQDNRASQRIAQKVGMQREMSDEMDEIWILT